MTAAIVVPHKFILGQTVEYYSPRGLYAPPGIYVVTAKLPERDNGASSKATAVVASALATF
jgi:hypothetical protein